MPCKIPQVDDDTAALAGTGHVIRRSQRAFAYSHRDRIADDRLDGDSLYFTFPSIMQPDFPLRLRVLEPPQIRLKHIIMSQISVFLKL